MSDPVYVRTDLLELAAHVFPEEQGWDHRPYHFGYDVAKRPWKIQFNYRHDPDRDEPPDPAWIDRVEIWHLPGSRLGYSLTWHRGDPLLHLWEALNKAQSKLVEVLEYHTKGSAPEVKRVCNDLRDLLGEVGVMISLLPEEP